MSDEQIEQIRKSLEVVKDAAAALGIASVGLMAILNNFPALIAALGEPA